MLKLPIEILTIILHCFSDINNVVCMRAVCKFFRSIMSDIPQIKFPLTNNTNNNNKRQKCEEKYSRASKQHYIRSRFITQFPRLISLPKDIIYQCYLII